MMTQVAKPLTADSATMTERGDAGWYAEICVATDDTLYTMPPYGTDRHRSWREKLSLPVTDCVDLEALEAAPATTLDRVEAPEQWVLRRAPRLPEGMVYRMTTESATHTRCFSTGGGLVKVERTRVVALMAVDVQDAHVLWAKYVKLLKDVAAAVEKRAKEAQQEEADEQQQRQAIAAERQQERDQAAAKRAQESADRLAAATERRRLRDVRHQED